MRQTLGKDYLLFIYVFLSTFIYTLIKMYIKIEEIVELRQNKVTNWKNY